MSRLRCVAGAALACSTLFAQALWASPQEPQAPSPLDEIRAEAEVLAGEIDAWEARVESGRADPEASHDRLGHILERLTTLRRTTVDGATLPPELDARLEELEGRARKALAGAGQGPQALEVSPSHGTGSISGTIRDAANNNPLQNVTVTIRDCTGVFHSSVNTNASGVYTDTGLGTGTYYASTSNSQGYVNKVYDNIPCLGSCPTSLITQGTAITVNDGVATPNIDFSLTKGGTISGKLTDAASSAAIANEEVDIFDARNSFVGFAFSDAGGNYQVTGLPAGTFHARALPFSGNYVPKAYNNLRCWPFCNANLGAAISVTAGSTTPNIDFALDKGGTITGKVTDSSTAAAIQFVFVRLYDALGRQVDSGSTNATGDYTIGGFTGLPAGKYYAVAQMTGYVSEVYDNKSCTSCNRADVLAGTQITVTAGSTTSNINFALAPAAGAGTGTIAGTITNSATSAALSAATVDFFNSSGSFVGSASFFGSTTGAYTSPSLPAGSYFVLASATNLITELYNNIDCFLGCTITSGTPVTVTGGSTTPNIDFALDPAGSISGTVTDATSTAPIGGVLVNVRTSTGAFAGSATTDCSGNYTVSGRKAGSYFVQTVNNPGGYLDELYNNVKCFNCSVTTSGGATVAVTGGSTTPGINFGLDKGGRISGTVTNAASAGPLNGVTVNIFDSAGFFLTSVSTRPDGKYLTGRGLPAASYFARTSNSFGFKDELYNNKNCSAGLCTITTGNTIPVTLGATAGGIDFALDSGGRIAGAVTRAQDGLPVAFVSGGVGRSNGTFATSTSTDGEGRYLTGTGLDSGSYFAFTSFNSFGLINELYDNIPCPLCSASSSVSGTPVSVSQGTTSGINLALNSGGRISGAVTDASTTQPIAGIGVQIRNTANVVMQTPITDQFGNYVSTSELPAGKYYLVAPSTGDYEGQVYNNLPCTGTCNSEGGTAVSLSEGGTATVSFALSKGGAISGTITDAATSTGLSGASVQLRDSLGNFLRSTTSASNGTYSFKGLRAGSYRIYVTASGRISEIYDNTACLSCLSREIAAGKPVTVTAGSTTSGIDVSVAAGNSISGTVTDSATSVGVSGVTVQFFDAAGKSITSPLTGSTGSFTTAALFNAGTYYARTSNSLGYQDEAYNNIPCTNCNALSGTPITVSSSNVTGFNFALDKGGQISGTVLEETTNAPISAAVNVYDSRGIFVTSAGTNSAGMYTISRGLPPGSYYLFTSNSVGYINELWDNVPCVGSCFGTRLRGTAVAVVAGSTTTANFSLAKGGRITGRVKDAATSTPLSGVSINIVNAGGGFVASDTTDNSGYYESNVGLAAGSYFVRTFNGHGFIDEAYDDVACAACDAATGKAVSVTAGQTTANIDFALAAGARFLGTVTDATSSIPLPNTTVQVYDVNGTFITANSSDHAGRYVIERALPAGTYYVVARFSPLGYKSRLHKDIDWAGQPFTSGTAISLSTTDMTVNFALSLGGLLAGKVTDAAGGAPLDGASVNVYNSSGQLAFITSTNTAGEFTSNALPAGNYYLMVSRDGYQPKIYDNIGCTACTNTSTSPQTRVPIAFNPTAGKAVAVTGTSTTSGINFALDGLTGLPLTLSVNDVTLLESGAGQTGKAELTVSLSRAPTQTVTVHFATGGGTAAAGSDYTASDGTLTFAPGETSKAVSVTVIGDAEAEANETFNLSLDTATGGATISKASGTVTIADPAAAGPKISIDDRSVAERGAANAAFRLVLSAPVGGTVTVNYTTADGSAKAGTDYVATSGTVTFTPGRTQQVVFVPILDDGVAEGTESFSVNLSGPTGGATLSDGQAEGVITDPPTPTKVPIYRSYNKNTDYHFFTLDKASHDFAVGVLGFQDEATPVPFYVWNTYQPGSVPLFRMYNPNLGRHYYTAGTTDRDFLISIGMTYEKDEGFLYLSPTTGTSELFRLYNNNSGTHLFTADPAQKDFILSVLSPPWVINASVGHCFRNP